MTAPIAGLTADSSPGGLAADSRSLDALRRAANADPAKAARQVATQFEALFLQTVLKSMRDAGPKSGLFDSEEEKLGRDLLDQQLAQKIAGSGTGLADVIVRQLEAAGALHRAQGAGAGSSPVPGGQDPFPGAVKQLSNPG